MPKDHHREAKPRHRAPCLADGLSISHSPVPALDVQRSVCSWPGWPNQTRDSDAASRSKNRICWKFAPPTRRRVPQLSNMTFRSHAYASPPYVYH